MDSGIGQRQSRVSPCHRILSRGVNLTKRVSRAPLAISVARLLAQILGMNNAMNRRFDHTAL